MSIDLKAHLARLREEKLKPRSPINLPTIPGKPNILFLGTSEDSEYLPNIKGMFHGLNTFICLEAFQSLTHLQLYCSRPDRNITRVVSTNTEILGRLLNILGNPKTDPSLQDYQGSVFTYGSLEFVFISPLKQLQTVAHGKFLASRFISKVCAPETWPEPTDFNFHILTPSNIDSFYNQFLGAYALACDIETFKKNLAIRCIGFTGVFLNPTSGAINTISCVLPIDSDWAVLWMKKFLQLPAPKIFQRGKYDVSYLLRYNCIPTRWYWDTANLFHSWYSELPKDLAYLNAFFLRKVVYWKDLSETSDLGEYYRYNALDTWATANVWIQQLLQLPAWAKRNYLLSFPMVYPCLLAELTGLKRDYDRLVIARQKIDAQEEKELTSLRKILGVPDFNPGSPPQVKLLLRLLGCSKEIKTTSEQDLEKAKFLHPLNHLILEKVLIIRGLRKLKTTYLRLDSDGKIKKSTGELEGGSKDFHGRMLYSLNPDGTKSGRLASAEHHFWTGTQVQNIPVGEDDELSWTKTTLCAEDGFYLGEGDLEQAESRDTAYIVGETKLIEAVTGSRDFHSVNVSAFFGVTYESIYDDVTGKTKNKPLRNIGKRVNHGANYNMGMWVLINTMGLKNVWMAKDLLKLPFYQPEEVTEYLLVRFHVTYDKIKGPTRIASEKVRQYAGLPQSTNRLYAPGTYYASVAYEISTTRKLVSRAYHHTEYNLRTFKADEYIEQGDWTRYCFGKPDTNKLDLNSYVSHPPQSLNARTINEAWLTVFYQVALPNPETFRLHAQIHDSIFFSYKEGYECHAEKVKELLQIPVTVRDISGVDRTFTVPAALKIGGKYWSDL